MASNRIVSTMLFTFFCGFLAYLWVDLRASWVSGETSSSLPVAALFVGFLCALSAHFVGPWASLGVFLLLAAVRFREAASERRDRHRATDVPRRDEETP